MSGIRRLVLRGHWFPGAYTEACAAGALVSRSGIRRHVRDWVGSFTGFAGAWRGCGSRPWRPCPFLGALAQQPQLLWRVCVDSFPADLPSSVSFLDGAFVRSVGRDCVLPAHLGEPVHLGQPLHPGQPVHLGEPSHLGPLLHPGESRTRAMWRDVEGSGGEHVEGCGGCPLRTPIRTPVAGFSCGRGGGGRCETWDGRGNSPS
jgi:hypothetical protein